MTMTGVRAAPLARGELAGAAEAPNGSARPVTFGKGRGAGARSDDLTFDFRVPQASAGLIIMLFAICAFERRFAFDLDKAGAFSVQSLIAFGAASHDLVFGNNDYWRLLTAPFLHASNMQLWGNCFALLLAAIRLEQLIGRGWTAALYVISGLGGVVVAIFANDPGVVITGASGGVVGVVVALFVVSFCREGDEDERQTMQKFCLYCGAPALAPIVWDVATGADYFCLAGGVFAGAAAALGLVLNMHGDRPPASRAAGFIAAGFFAAAVASAVFVVTAFSAHAAFAAQLAPTAVIPEGKKINNFSTIDLLRSYPKDPYAHFMRGMYLLEAKRFDDAEAAFRVVFTIKPPPGVGRPLRLDAQAGVAYAVALQDRVEEARKLAALPCDSAAEPMRRMLSDAKLCD